MNVFLRSVIFGPLAIILAAISIIGATLQASGQRTYDFSSGLLIKVVNFAIKKFPNKNGGTSDT